MCIANETRVFHSETNVLPTVTWCLLLYIRCSRPPDKQIKAFKPPGKCSLHFFNSTEPEPLTCSTVLNHTDERNSEKLLLARARARTHFSSRLAANALRAALLPTIHCAHGGR